MPVPKQRLSSRRGRTRASHHGLKKVATIECAECHEPKLPHRACPACGAYRGRNVRRPIARPAKVKPTAESAPAEPAKA